MISAKRTKLRGFLLLGVAAFATSIAPTMQQAPASAALQTFVIEIAPHADEALRAKAGELRRIAVDSIEKVQAVRAVTDGWIEFESGKAVIPEVGLAAMSFGQGSRIKVIVDVSRPDWLDSLRKWFPSILAHELGHIVRVRGLLGAVDPTGPPPTGPKAMSVAAFTAWSRGRAPTLGEFVVHEGIADHFAMEVVGDGPYPWDKALKPDQLEKWTNHVLEHWDEPDYDAKAWVGGSGDIPLQAAYAVGFRLVADYLAAHPGVKPSRILREPAAVFRPGDGRMPLQLSYATTTHTAEQRARQLMAIWESGDTAQLAEIMAPEVVYDDVPNGTRLMGVEGVRRYVKHLHAWAAKVKITVDAVHGSQGSAVAEWTMCGIQDRPIPGRVQAATNRAFELKGATLVEVSGGKIVRAADYMDVLGFVIQLGARVELPGGVVIRPDESGAMHGVPPKSKRNEAAERFFRGVFSGDSKVVDDLAADDIVISYPIFQKLFGKPVIRGLQAAKEFARGFALVWADPHITIHEAIEDADRVVLVWSLRAKNVGSRPGGPPATNQVQSWGGISLFRFDANGKIVAEIGEESEPGPIQRIGAGKDD